jgi:hypothetical protein
MLDLFASDMGGDRTVGLIASKCERVLAKTTIPAKAVEQLFAYVTA